MASKRKVTKLKPCPFCGGKPVRDDTLTKGVEGAVRCTECTAATLMSDWNRRTTRAKAR